MMCFFVFLEDGGLLLESRGRMKKLKIEYA